MAEIVCALVRLYQRVLSARFGGSCRFTPSCSRYALEAVRRHGVVTGVRLAACRLARCRPSRPGGHDPVPEPGRVGEACKGALVREDLPASPPTRRPRAPGRRLFSKADLAKGRR